MVLITIDRNNTTIFTNVIAKCLINVYETSYTITFSNVVDIFL